MLRYNFSGINPMSFIHRKSNGQPKEQFAPPTDISIPAHMPLTFVICFTVVLNNGITYEYNIL